MGRSASHIALECTYLTRPNYCFIGEEVEKKKLKLKDLCNILLKLIVERHKQGKDYGVILVPEGLIEFISEVKILIKEINKHFKETWKGKTFIIENHLPQLYKLLTP